VFVRKNCKELWGNLKQWYLVNGHGNLFFLFYISKHCMIDNNNLWKFDKSRKLNFISGEWPWLRENGQTGIKPWNTWKWAEQNLARSPYKPKFSVFSTYYFFKCCLYMWASMKLVSNALVITGFIWKSFQKFCKQHGTVQEMDNSRNKNKWWACWTQIRYEPFDTTNTLRFEQAFLV